MAKTQVFVEKHIQPLKCCHKFCVAFPPIETIILFHKGTSLVLRKCGTMMK